MRTILSVLIIGTVAATVSAQMPNADADRDLVTRVKSALAAHGESSKLSLTVSVLDGVAVIGGAVPNATLNESLAACVKTVPGLKDVRVNCWVPTNEDPLATAVKLKLNETVGRDAVVIAPPSPPLRMIPPAHITVAQRGEPVPQATGYSPVPPPAPPAPSGRSEHETIPPPRVPMKPGQDVAAAVDAVKRFDNRYAAMTLTLNIGTVTITGTDGDAAWDLAGEVRRVPGVERVIVSHAKR